MTTSKNIGTALQEHKSAALRWLAGTMGVIVYLGMVGYAEVRNYTLLARTIDLALLPLAIVGVVAMGLTALALPLLVHHGTEPGAHRLFAMLFYGSDLVLMATNAVLDAALHTTDALTGPLQLWGTYVVPITPLLIGLGWAVLWLLDPAQRERDLLAEVRAATRHALAQQVIEVASHADVNAEVQTAAQSLTRQIVAEALGQAIPKRLDAPAPTTVQYNAQHEAASAAPVKRGRNGNKPEVNTDPK